MLPGIFADAPSLRVCVLEVAGTPIAKKLMTFIGAGSG